MRVAWLTRRIRLDWLRISRGPWRAPAAVGDAAVEGNADEGDVEPGRILAIRRPHEGRDAGIARPHHRVGILGVAQITMHRRNLVANRPV